MGVPRKKVTRAKRGARRSHDTLARSVYVECSECGELKRPHHVCGYCGYYDGRVFVSLPVDDDEDEAA